MTSLSLTAATSDQSILFAGEHPERGTFLALVEHAGGWPTYVTAVLDGELVPLEALGSEAAERIADVAAQILARLTPPQLEAGDLATD